MDLEFVYYVDIIYRIYLFLACIMKKLSDFCIIILEKQNLKSFSLLPVECQENPDREVFPVLFQTFLVINMQQGTMCIFCSAVVDPWQLMYARINNLYNGHFFLPRVH